MRDCLSKWPLSRVATALLLLLLFAAPAAAQSDAAHQQFLFAYKLLQRGDDRLAAAGFDEYLGDFPQDDKRGDAHSARNVLGIDVTTTDVAFLVNDTEVARLPRTELDAEGIVGLRINHALNVHVTSLEVTPSR